MSSLKPGERSDEGKLDNMEELMTEGVSSTSGTSLNTDDSGIVSESRSDEVRSQTDEVRSQTDEVRSQTDEVRSQTDKVESQTKIRSQTDEVRSQTDEVRSQTDEVGSQTDKVESQTKIRSQTDEVRSRTDEVRSQTDEVGSQTDKVKSQTKIRSQTDEVRSQTDEVRSQTEEVRSQTDEVRSQTDEVRSQTKSVELRSQSISYTDFEPSATERLSATQLLNKREGSVYAKSKDSSKMECFLPNTVVGTTESEGENRMCCQMEQVLNIGEVVHCIAETQTATMKVDTCSCLDIGQSDLSDHRKYLELTAGRTLESHCDADNGDNRAFYLHQGQKQADISDDDDGCRIVTADRQTSLGQTMMGRNECAPQQLDMSDQEIEKIVVDILNKPTPKPDWFVVSELRRREYGYTSCHSYSTRHSYNSFREHVQGSLEMVKRLVFMESLRGHEGCVNTLSFNRTGTLVASGSDDLKIILWNWQRNRASLIYGSGHQGNVFQVKFMPYSGDCHVISCGRDGQVRLAELSLTGVCKSTRKLAQHRGAAHKVAVEDSPNIFLSCGEDAVVYLFDLRESRPHKLVTTKENNKRVPLYSVHINPCDSQQFCVGGRDHYVRVYDKRKMYEDGDGGVVKKFCPDNLVNTDQKANVTCACYSYNGAEILASYNDEDIYLFDNNNSSSSSSSTSNGGSYLHRYMGHRNNATVKAVSFYGPKSEFIVSGSDCSFVYFWDKQTEALVNFQKGDEMGIINVLEAHPNLPVMATSGLDYDVKMWMPAPQVPALDMDLLTETLIRNQKDRITDRANTEPETIEGQMLWFIMNHFQSSARRRLMREQGLQVSSSEDDDDSDSLSDDSTTGQTQQCSQS